MPFALVLIGLLMIVVGSKNTYREFGAELAGDFSGPGNFTYWIGALGAMGAMGYVPALRNFSRLFMALILIAMVLSNRGFFQRLTEAFELGPVKPGTSGNVTKVSEASQPNQNIGAAKNDNGAQASNTDAQNNFMTVMQGVKLLMGIPG